LRFCWLSVRRRTPDPGPPRAACFPRRKWCTPCAFPYEFNNDYRKLFEKAGMMLSGISPNGMLVEIVELKHHPWFVGVQFHPEFKSRPIDPHPLFRDFVAASLKNTKVA